MSDSGSDAQASRALAGWVPDTVAALVVAAVGFLEMIAVRLRARDALRPRGLGDPSAAFIVALVVGIALAVGLSRRAPALALTLAWLIGMTQLITETPVMLFQLALGAVVFGTARWGRPLTAFLGAVSVPAVPMAGVALVNYRIFYQVADLTSLQPLLSIVFQSGQSTWRVLIAVVAVGVLGVPWLAGLAARFIRRNAESRRSMAAAEQETLLARRELDQAREIARLREQQTQLANDVHDVVGHSLTVILAQAQSAQYLPDTEVVRIKDAMANVAESARSSLQEVRAVLSTDGDTGSRMDSLDDLITATVNSRPGIQATEIGRPRPLPPERAVVAHRVLQEMLTNALKHGCRDRPMTIERAWSDDGGTLRFQVGNIRAPAPTDATPAPSNHLKSLTEQERTATVIIRTEIDSGGQGLPSMQSRLQAIGGRLEITERRESDGAIQFVATGWLPVRAAGR